MYDSVILGIVNIYTNPWLPNADSVSVLGC